MLLGNAILTLMIGPSVPAPAPPPPQPQPQQSGASTPRGDAAGKVLSPVVRRLITTYGIDASKVLSGNQASICI